MQSGCRKPTLILSTFVDLGSTLHSRCTDQRMSTCMPAGIQLLSQLLGRVWDDTAQSVYLHSRSDQWCCMCCDSMHVSLLVVVMVVAVVSPKDLMRSMQAPCMGPATPHSSQLANLCLLRKPPDLDKMHITETAAAGAPHIPTCAGLLLCLLAMCTTRGCFIS